jgi:hypothetical protein
MRIVLYFIISVLIFTGCATKKQFVRGPGFDKASGECNYQAKTSTVNVSAQNPLIARDLQVDLYNSCMESKGFKAAN